MAKKLQLLKMDDVRGEEVSLGISLDKEWMTVWMSILAIEVGMTIDY